MTTAARAPGPSAAPRYLALCVLVAACGGSGPRPAPPPPRSVGPLALLVPAGATVVVTAHPDALWAAPASRAIVEALAPESSIADLATRTGVDPRRATEAVVAEYGGGTLLLVRGPFVASEVVVEAEVRMSIVDSRSDAPFVRRGGLFGNDRWDLAAVGPDVLAVASDVEALAGVLACAAPHAAHAAPCHPAVASPEARALEAASRAAPIAVLAPDHLELPPGLGTSLLLAEERALVATGAPDGDGIALRVDLRGDFPPGADGNFRSLVESVSRTELGGVLGVEDALPTLLVARSGEGVQLSARVLGPTILRAVRTVFGGEIRDILAPAPTSDSSH